MLLWSSLALALSPIPNETVTVAVWIAADNDLETLLYKDIEELEASVSDRVHVVAQIDRIDGYERGQGNWTDTRRFDFVADQAKGVVSQPVEMMGEVNMGDGDELADFLLWANDRHPSDRFVVVMWNHGAGFWIASDDTNGGDKIQIEDGELSNALQALVDARGKKIDVVAFDACNMAEWEVATAIAPQAHVMTASSAWVGSRGYKYDVAFANLPEVADGHTLGEALAYSAGIVNAELTQSAIDLDQIGQLDAAIDELATAWRADPSTFPAARDAARSLDRKWEDWWIDVGELADQAALASPALVAPSAAVRDALGAVVIANYTQPGVDFSSGITLFGDTSRRSWLRQYQTGPWATTAWDELLIDAARLPPTAP